MGKIAILTAAVLLATAPSSYSEVPAQSTPESVRYLDAILGTLAHLEQELPSISTTAEAIAERITAGGHLYFSGDFQGFAEEALGRAGGSMYAWHFKYRERFPEGPDVLVYGSIGLDPEAEVSLMKSAKESGILTVYVGSADGLAAQIADHRIATGLPSGAVPIVRVPATGDSICPAGPTANIAAMWVLTGEMVAAYTRRGKMPTMWQSILIPGSNARNRKIRRLAFHDDVEVAAVPSGQLGRDYIAEIRRCLKGIRSGQMPAIEQAGQIVGGAKAEGNKAWIFVLGHYLSSQFGLPGDPGVYVDSLATTMDEATIRSAVGNQDVVVYIGYYNFPQLYSGVDDRGEIQYLNLDFLRDVGKHTVLALGGLEQKLVTPGERVTLIDGQWRYGDTAVEVPGYDTGILPPSGVVQTCVLWMIAAEAELERTKEL